MKKVLTLVLAVVLTFGLSIVMVQATNEDDGIMPCLNNTNSASLSFNIDSSGNVYLGLKCAGITGVTTKITAKTKLERKWGIFWLDVEGAEWTDTSTDLIFTKSHEITLTKTGTYRATTVYTVTGSGGSADEITCQVKDTY